MEVHATFADVVELSFRFFGVFIAGSWVELVQYVGGTLVQGAALSDPLDVRFRRANAEVGNEICHQPVKMLTVGLAVDGDRAVVDTRRALTSLW